MQLSHLLSSPGARRWSGIALGLAAAATVAACNTDRAATDPELPENPPPNAQLRNASFIFDVDVAQRRVMVREPALRVEGINASVMGSRSLPGGPSFSVLAGDVIELTTSNFSASGVGLGGAPPGKVLVTFDVNITNELSSVQLITPTFPTPPAGTNGIILFPFEEVVTTTSGGTSVGGDGTDVIVELPNRGEVEPSTDWNGDGTVGSGSPWNFFNDAGCAAGSNDCYRYETFLQPLLGGATSEARQVGFIIDPTVANFRARLIVTADLQNQAGAAQGAVAGSVTSPQRGALSGVTVTVTAGGRTDVTDAAGAYSIDSVSIGPKSVSLSGLPAACTNPGPQNITVVNGTTTTVNFTVTCTSAVGTVAGTVTSSLGGGVQNVTMTVTPATGGGPFVGSTNAAGDYSVASVLVGLGAGAGSGSVTLGNLPANCTNPGPQTYSGLTEGGTVDLDITVACTPPPQGYQLTTEWGTPSGGSVTMTMRINMGTYDDPAIPGADDIFAAQGSFSYPTARLSAPSCANVGGSGLTNGAFNTATPGVIQWGNFTTNPAPQTGLQGIMQCTFTVTGTGPSVGTTVVTIAESANGTNLVPRVLISDGTLN